MAGAGALIAALLACTGSQRTSPSVPELEGSAAQVVGEYEIGADDILVITVWREDELSSKVQVRPDGKISFPLLDDVQAAGLTPLELKQVISERLGEYVANPQVTVVVESSRSRVVYMLGEVVKQGPVFLSSRMRVTDALSTAGGFGPFAGKRRVKILRRLPDGSSQEFRFNYEAYIDGTDVAQNILLLPGDQIFVPEESLLPWR
jgi:polysaccharide export outer membrane protein